MYKYVFLQKSFHKINNHACECCYVTVYNSTKISPNGGKQLLYIGTVEAFFGHCKVHTCDKHVTI